MFTTALYAIGSVSLLSLVALAGIFALSVRKETIDKAVSYLVPLAVGAMLGTGIFHLLPESYESLGGRNAGLLIGAGVLACYLLEKWLSHSCHSASGDCNLPQERCHACNCGGKAHHDDHDNHDEHADHGHEHGDAEAHDDHGHAHGHDAHEHKHGHVEHSHAGGHGHAHRAEFIHPTGWMSLISHNLHNLADGALIAASYMVSPSVGLTTTLAILLHEIPMEFGEFGILINAGFKRTTAVWVNALSGVFALIGAAITLWVGAAIPWLDPLITAVGAGMVLYIATVGLLPQLLSEKCTRKSRTQFLIMLGAIALMYWVSSFQA
jgi:zinc transporter ZupT